MFHFKKKIKCKLTSIMDIQTVEGLQYPPFKYPLKKNYKEKQEHWSRATSISYHRNYPVTKNWAQST